LFVPPKSSFFDEEKVNCNIGPLIYGVEDGADEAGEGERKQFTGK